MTDATSDRAEPRPGAAANAALREAAEVLAGTALLAFQRLQVRRREVERSFGIAPGTPLIETLRRLGRECGDR